MNNTGTLHQSPTNWGGGHRFKLATRDRRLSRSIHTTKNNSLTSAQAWDKHKHLYQPYSILPATLFLAIALFAVEVVTMDKSKYAVRVDNIYFLNRIGASLRWATEDIAWEELPADIKHLLSRLNRLEARARAKGRDPGDGSSH